MNKQKFRVQLTTKGGYDIEIAQLDLENVVIEDLSSSDAWDLLYDGEYILNCGLGDEWCGQFTIEVYDENDNLVYENDDFSNFNFISSEDVVLENPSIKPHLQTFLNLWKSEDDSVEPGTYIAGLHEMKWQEFSFVVEDTTFDPEKLYFIHNKTAEGLIYDYMTDPWHIFYDDKFVKAEYCMDSEDEYGTNFHIVKRENGCFEFLHSLDD